MREGFDRSAYLENTLKGIGALEEYAERYLRIRTIRLYPFCALEEYAHILYAYLENTHKSAYSYSFLIHGKDISVLSICAKRI